MFMALDAEVHEPIKEHHMLVAFTSLAMIALAIHTKRIHADAMEEMLSESREKGGPRARQLQRREAS